MQGYSYSVFSSVAILIHLIINYNLFLGRGIVSERGRRYRWFLFAILAYYITDAAWGVFAGLKWTAFLYLDTIFFFLSLVAFVIMWSRYVIAYLRLSQWPTRVLTWFGYGIMVFNIVALTANPFNNCFFHINPNGVYKTGDMRDPAFFLLVALNLLMGGIVFVKALRSRDAVRRRCMMVLMCCITMGLAILLQIIWPLTPYTALGCLVSNCFLHVFVVSDELAAKQMAELEKALSRARKAERAKSMFFSNVSHDIRTPLNAIIGYTELLTGGIADEKERSRALAAISTSGQTLLQLINDVLDLSKLESGKMVIKPELTDVRELVSLVVQSFEVTTKDSDVELKEEYGNLPLLEVDPQRIRQVLFNLIGNAVKFTEHGEIRVSASFRKESVDGTGVFTLSVADTGCGIAEEDKASVMDPFVQVGSDSKARGTGLGLPICKQLAADMGGQLSFVSELGKGSTFTLELFGVKSAEATPDAGTAGQETAPGQTRRESVSAVKPRDGRKVPEKCHILIVDDVPLNLDVLKALLKRIGMKDVETAVDGEEAWEKLLASKRPFDFVLTDVWMPKMDGRELVLKIRADKRFAALPVYAVTADTEEKKTSAEHKFTGTLLKPLTGDKLSELFK